MSSLFSNLEGHKDADFLIEAQVLTGRYEPANGTAASDCS
jgi:hypothetical protein